MKVQFYGRLGEALGRERALDPPARVRTVADLRGFLAELYPAAADDLASRTLRACVDDRIVPDDHDISRSEAVEFFPPLSGG